MAALIDTEATRLGTATCVAGGTITQLLRASTSRSTVTPPKGDLLLAAALMNAASATHFETTKRAAAQRRDLTRQPQERSYSQQAAVLRDLAARAPFASVLSSSAAPIVHNLRDARPALQQQQAAAAQAQARSSAGKWHFDLALQSSLL